MPISKTPVLSASAGYEDDVPTQVANLLRWFIMNPGGTSDLWEGSLISLRDLVARSEDKPSELASSSARAVRSVLTQKFTDYDFDCDFTTSDYTKGVKDGRYRLKFAITFTKQGSGTVQGALVSGQITVNSVTHEIDISFTNTR